MNKNASIEKFFSQDSQNEPSNEIEENPSIKKPDMVYGQKNFESKKLSHLIQSSSPKNAEDVLPPKPKVIVAEEEDQPIQEEAIDKTSEVKASAQISAPKRKDEALSPAQQMAKRFGSSQTSQFAQKRKPILKEPPLEQKATEAAEATKKEEMPAQKPVTEEAPLELKTTPPSPRDQDHTDQPSDFIQSIFLIEDDEVSAETKKISDDILELKPSDDNELTLQKTVQEDDALELKTSNKEALSLQKPNIAEDTSLELQEKADALSQKAKDVRKQSQKELLLSEPNVEDAPMELSSKKIIEPPKEMLILENPEKDAKSPLPESSLGKKELDLLFSQFSSRKAKKILRSWIDKMGDDVPQAVLDSLKELEKS